MDVPITPAGPSDRRDLGPYWHAVPGPKPTRKNSGGGGAATTLIGALLIVVGVLLPWFTIVQNSGDVVTWTGSQNGDGPLFLVAGIIIALIGLFRCIIWVPVWV